MKFIDFIKLNIKKIVAILVVITIMSCAGFVAYDYIEDQRIAAEEKARLEEEKALEEQLRIAELEKTKAETLQYLEEQIILVSEYLTDENKAELENIKAEIESLEYGDDIFSIIKKIDAIIAQANELKIAAEEAAIIQQQQQQQQQQSQQYYESISEYDAEECIAQRESGGSYEAHNGQYWGRYQLSSGWFDGYDKDYILNTEEGHAIQEEKANEYVEGRYGSWENAHNFWQNNGWY